MPILRAAILARIPDRRRRETRHDSTGIGRLQEKYVKTWIRAFYYPTQLHNIRPTHIPPWAQAINKSAIRPMKSELRSWLVSADFRKDLDAASDSNRIIGTLITLTYSNDTLLSWRAIDAIGRCAVQLASHKPEVLKKYLRRLFWMMTDESGSIAPRAPEAIGEIIRSNPEEFSDFIPLTVSLMNLEPEDRPVFLPGILYALGRIGEAAAGTIDDTEGIEPALSDPDSQVRAMAVWCLGRIGGHDILLRHPELEKDNGEAQLYHEEHLLDTTVGDLYKKTLQVER